MRCLGMVWPYRLGAAELRLPRYAQQLRGRPLHWLGEQAWICEGDHVSHRRAAVWRHSHWWAFFPPQHLAHRHLAQQQMSICISFLVVLFLQAFTHAFFCTRSQLPSNRLLPSLLTLKQISTSPFPLSSSSWVMSISGRASLCVYQSSGTEIMKNTYKDMK